MTINLKDHAKMTASIRRDRDKYRKTLGFVIDNAEQSAMVKCNDCFVVWQIAKEALKK